jgi:hypothetical protein
MQKTLPITGEAQPLASSYYTDVASIKHEDTPTEDKQFVVKVSQSRLQRTSKEDDASFYARRYQEAQDTIKWAQESEKEVTDFISRRVPELIMPREEWFIFKADDGYPLGGRIQEEIKGKILKDYGLENLDEQQIDVLKRLLAANIDCYAEKKVNLDIFGSSTDEEDYLRLKQLAFGMLRRSVNLIVTDTGEIALIDLRFTNMGKLIEAVKHIRTRADFMYLKKLTGKIIE